MSAFSAIAAKVRRKAPATVRLPPSAFADTCPDKPTVDVLVGIRLIAEGDMMNARSTAAARAARELPGVDPGEDVWIEAYNQALMHWAIAAAACHPDNVDEPYWDMAFDMVPRILSEGGTERLYEEIEALKVVHSPTSREITPAETARLVAALQGGDFWRGMTVGDKRRAGRLLLRCAYELGCAAGE